MPCPGSVDAGRSCAAGAAVAGGDDPGGHRREAKKAAANKIPARLKKKQIYRTHAHKMSDTFD
jgi:hypothetical protein